MRVTFSLAFAIAAAVLFGSFTPSLAGEVLKHEKYQLDNGLTVILHPDHKLPQVVVNLWYHVGTREEPLGRSGFAHLFEHLMFMGTEHVPDNQFDITMESLGARNNASTWFDRTNYYDWGPASALPTLLWLEADRMTGLSKAMTQKKLDLQRDVVRNERREGYDNAPYGPSQFIVWERMFPLDHPYHFHVIGSHKDLVAAQVDDVVGFYDTYYVPNNATLVVAGDFDAAKIKPLIKSLFGAIPRGDVPPRRSTPVARLDRVERLTLDDKVQLPKVTMVWHSPAFYGPGDAEMDLVAAALSEGENGRLRKRLMRDEQLAVEVAAYQLSLRLGSLFFIEATARPGVSLDKLEAAIDDELRKIALTGPSKRELLRAVADLETRTLTGLQSLREAADLLNQYDAHLGDPDRVDWDLDRYREATPLSVQPWIQRVIDLDRRFIMRVVPRKEPAADGPKVQARPADFPPADFSPPEPVVLKVDGCPLGTWHLDKPGLPLVSMALLLPGGSLRVDPKLAGLAELTATMLSEGTKKRDALAFADALEVLGAQFSVSAGQYDTTVSLTVLERNFDEALGLVMEMLREPRFEEKDFERRKALQRAQLERLVDEPTSMARRVAQQAYFRGVHADPISGYPQTVARITLDDVKAFHEAHHGPLGATLIIAGDLRAEEARALLAKHTKGWDAAHVPVAVPDDPEEFVVLFVDKPGAAQTVVRFVHTGVGFESEERVGLEVLNSLFGGSFTSRLNANLREKHGYTYGAGSAFRFLGGLGTFVASSNVQTGKTGAALEQFFHEFDRIRKGDVTVEEVTKAVATVRYDTVESFGTLERSVSAFVPYARHGQEPGMLARDLVRLTGIDAKAVSALAAKRIAKGGGVLVLVGDKAKVLPQLAGLGLPAPRVLDMEQALKGELFR